MDWNASITRASDRTDTVLTKTISSLEELDALIKDAGGRVIIALGDLGRNPDAVEITIYDDYVE